MRKHDLILALLAAFTPLALAACFEDPATDTSGETSEDETTDPSGDGDGDPTTSGDGDGDGDPTTSGDGDGDPTTGDGDGDPATGDGDGDPTTGDGDGDTGEEGFCGDGIVNGDEVCDEGPEPPLADGACKPDCSGTIETLRLVKAETLADGDFGNNPVATLDATCPVGYAAMFADGVARRATTTAWETVDPIDWPIQPYTRYINGSMEEVWITDEVALLGIRDGAHVDLTNPAGVSQNCVNMICTNFRMISGIQDDGTTLLSDSCNGWTSAAPNLSGSVGSFANGDYVNGTVDCDFSWMFLPTFYQALCVELP